MALPDIAKENIADSNENMKTLEYRSPAWWKQRRRRFENFLMLIYLQKKENKEAVARTRDRLKETMFHPESFITQPPPPKADEET